jgi:hypothetical protein
MKKMNRRQFAKLAGGAALAVPLAPEVAATLRRHASPGEPAATPEQQAGEPPRAESKLKLTPEQEERLKQAAERRERQMAPLRSRALAYDLEPAFVFRVKAR